ncbi:hypothetical protein KB206_20610 [Microvirga sp. STS02]|uniref:hypothetical protein n=1 Tax=Hymenobacter negativus TaxID=2795026 RepID=UPI0018DCBEFB|nr:MULTISPECIES: hypothetical protein [Bacteria]MBH8571306.1 hypothetical protein [Hymenobacter negativus]MBR7211044.1 hypothetical protein [Microvirga sp. STS02]
MLSFTTEKVRVPSSSNFSGFAKVAHAEMANGAVEEIAADLRRTMSNQRCEHHPNHTSTVVLRALDRPGGNLFDVQKRGFCCREFENTIQVTVKR